MQKKKRTARSYALDGFKPRSNATPRRKRASIDSMEQQATPELRSAEQQLSFDDEIPQQTDTDGSLKAPIDLGSLPEKPRKPRLWQFRKRRQWRKDRQSRRKKIAKRIALLILIIGLLVGGFLGWKFLKNTTKVFDGNILGFFDSTKLKGEDQGRVNILLTGTSEDDPGHDGAKLTDSIMIVSVDTVNNKAFMISIPRDLWVNYQTRQCSVGYQGKINAAYTCGEQIEFSEPGFAPGGLGLLEKILEQNFGLPIHYYAKINYTAFKQAVDAVGGINITLKTDSSNGILDRIFDWQCNYKCFKVKYPNGPLQLNGQQALDLARARGDSTGYPTYGTGNDFGRTERQRQMLIALKDRALSAGILTNPAKISSLLDAAGNNVDTDFKTNELRRLYEISKNVKSQDIRSIGLTDEDVSLVETFRAVDGSSAVRPTAGTTDFSQIQAFIKKLTSSDPVVQEGASVVVLNGSGVVGLAQKQADQLTAKGLIISSVANAATTRPATILIEMNSGKMPATKKLLQSQLNVTATTDLASHPEAKNYQADYIIILGKPAAAPPANN